MRPGLPSRLLKSASKSSRDWWRRLRFTRCLPGVFLGSSTIRLKRSFSFFINLLRFLRLLKLLLEFPSYRAALLRQCRRHVDSYHLKVFQICPPIFGICISKPISDNFLRPILPVRHPLMHNLLSWFRRISKLSPTRGMGRRNSWI